MNVAMRTLSLLPRRPSRPRHEVGLLIACVSMATLACTSDDGDDTNGDDIGETSGTAEDTSGTSGTSGETGESSSEEGSSDTGGDTEASIESVTVTIPENCGLTAVVEVETSDAADVHVEYTDIYGQTVRSSTSPQASSHRILVAGLHPEQSYDLNVVATSLTVDEQVEVVTTEPLPNDTLIGSLEVGNEVDPATHGPTLVGPSPRVDLDPSAISDAPVALTLDHTGAVNWYYYDPLVSETSAARGFSKIDEDRFMLRVPGEIRILNAACEILETYTSPIPDWNLHHDVIMLPSGNLLALARERKDVDVPFLGGTVSLQGDTLIEMSPSGEAVWTWTAFDHLDTQRFPGALSQTPKGPSMNIYYDWTHGNGLYYDESDDSILISLRHQNWVIKVDHATGDVVWTLGDGGDFALGGADSEWFYSQHMPSVTSDGTILIYDNGNERPSGAASYSRAVRYAVDDVNMTAAQTWAYTLPNYTAFLGSAEELASGNILIGAGGQRMQGAPAQVIEVDPSANNEVVWQVDYDDTFFYRARRASSLAGESVTAP